MKFYESHFEDYIKTYETNPIQKNIDINIKSCSFDKLNNLIIYGPAGVGKYSQTLSLIKNFSLSKLKYEKKWQFLLIKIIIILK